MRQLSKAEVRCVVENVMALEATASKLMMLDFPVHPEIEGLRMDMIAVSQSTEAVMRKYAAEFPPSAWALKYVSPHLAAGLRAAIYTDESVESPGKLIVMAGMEARRYISVDEAKQVMRAYVLPNDVKGFSNTKLKDIAKHLDRDPGPLLGTSPSWDTVFLWATARRHSEFLRGVCLRISEELARQPEGTKYREIRDRVMDEESQKNLESGRNLILAQIESRAKLSACRAFLTDYWEILHEVDQQEAARRGAG